MMSSPELRLKPDHEIQLGDATSVVRPAGSVSKPGPNTTTPSQAESLLAAEKRTLEMMANGASLSEVLNDLCASIDAHAPPVTSMVCLMDGEWLSPCAGPHVPATFKAAITPWRIGPDRASCGAAAFTKQRVIVPNISKDPRWPDDARDLTLSHGFSAAWSEPLISKDGEVLGTFAMYYPEPRTPLSSDLELINAAGHIALIAIELERSHLALKKVLVEIKSSENRLRTIIDTIPALAWSARPDGSAEFFNQRWLDYAGLSAEEAADWGWTVALHPEDRGRLMDYWRHVLASGEAGEIEARLRRFDAEYRWFLFRASPLRNDSGRIVKWYGTNTDLEERKRAEEALRSNEQSLRLIVDTIPGLVCTMSAAGEVELLNRQVLEYFGKTTEELKNWATSDAVHPDDLPRLIDAWRHSVETGQPYEYELRQRRADGMYRWFQARGLPLRDTEGRITGWYLLLTDIDDRKKAEVELRRGKAYLTEAQRLSQTGSFGCRLSTGEMFWSEETFRIYGYDRSTQPAVVRVLERVHPEDQALVQERMDQANRDEKDCRVECRLLLPDGSVKHVCIVAHASKNESGTTEFIGAVMDVTARKHAEEELQQLVDFVGQIITVLSLNGKIHYANRVAREYTGLTLDEYRSVDVIARVIHPDDMERMRAVRERGLSANNPFEIEARTLGKGGVCRWFLYRYNPLRDERGQITRWYVTGTDIENRKQAEDRLRQENVALREEIVQASMFEEIVGTSPALKSLLSRISKVAPSDSTVLITGETGTGKELVARAIHRRSDRASRAFVSANCAAIPRDLIASELFGHERGAFTGATQQRLGRFELASGGTIFLDEVGELPAETQVALLRVLQEREFERVGGTRRIRTDVRVIAATNRDLQAAISAGSFRSDLFYRLNVFPIEIPSLRERREDIPLLVEYFIDRYARKAAKNIKRVNKKTLELLQSYPWPGNIRELQNVIERSVILCETEIFSIDESWLPKQPSLTEPKNQMELPGRLLAQEKEMIEAALKESRGRIFGPKGAAAKLGIPRSTLESKIRSLKIRPRLSFRAASIISFS